MSDSPTLRCAKLGTIRRAGVYPTDIDIAPKHKTAYVRKLRATLVELRRQMRKGIGAARRAEREAHATMAGVDRHRGGAEPPKEDA